MSRQQQRSVDLVVARGNIVALLGSNGAGKTTVVRVLSTLLRADAGTARVNGFDVAARGGGRPRVDQPHRAVRGRRRGEFGSDPAFTGLMDAFAEAAHPAVPRLRRLVAERGWTGWTVLEKRA